jgi:SAM-dependent methyltransferase
VVAEKGQPMVSRIGRLYFEYLHLRYSDPWSYLTSPYERDKYARTLAALADRTFDRALEVGCSIGVLTSLLAPRCRELVAVDTARLAVARARRRLSGTPGVRVERRTLPRDMPPGPFDLIVCSEILFYWSSEVLMTTLTEFDRLLVDGGVVLAVHWRGRNPHRPLQAEEVHELLRQRLPYAHVDSAAEEGYLLDRFDKAGRRFSPTP